MWLLPIRSWVVKQRFQMPPVEAAEEEPTIECSSLESSFHVCIDNYITSTII